MYNKEQSNLEIVNNYNQGQNYQQVVKNLNPHIIQQSNALIQTINEVNYLKNYNEKLIYDNINLIDKIQRILEAKDLATEELISIRGNLFYLKNNTNLVKKSIIFAEFDIKEIYILYFDKKYNKEKELLIILNNDTEIIVPYEKFNSKSIVKIFNLNGIKFLLKANNEKIGALLLNYVAQKINERVKPIYVSYCSGWYKTDIGWVYKFRKDCDIKMNVPRYLNQLETTDRNEPVNLCGTALGYYKIFKREEDRVILLSVLFYSLLYTRFKNLNLVINQIFLLTGDSMYFKKVIELFLKVFNKCSGNLMLDNKFSDIEKSVIDTKDFLLIIDGRNSKMTDYLPKSNIEKIKKFFCYGEKCKGFEAEAPVLIIDKEICYGNLESELMIPIEIEEENLDMKKLLMMNKEDYYIFSDLIWYFLEYAENIHIKNDLFENDCEYGTYTVACEIFKKVINIFSDFLKSYKLDFYECLEVSRDYHLIIDEFFNKEFFDEKCINDLFQESIMELLQKRNIRLLTNNTIFAYEKLDRVIFLIDDEVRITLECIKNIILTNMGISISVRGLLRQFNNMGILKTNKNSFECKRTVICQNEKKQERFVVFKREEFDIFNENIEQKEENINNEKDFWNF